MIEENGTCTLWFKGLNFKVNLNSTVSSSAWDTFAFDIFVFFTIILSVIRRVSFAIKKLDIGKLTGNKPCTLKSIKLEFTNINFLHKYNSYTYNDHWSCMCPHISYIYIKESDWKKYQWNKATTTINFTNQPLSFVPELPLPPKLSATLISKLWWLVINKRCAFLI